MIREEERDEIADAVLQRKLMLERELLAAAGERRAEIALDIEACRSLLSKLEESPRRPAAGATIH
jgi:hypothetical protein